MAVGVRVKHSTLRNCVHVVPVLKKPYADGGFICPTCQILHPVKAVHLWLDATGTCLVSEGVLEELKLAGLPDLTVIGATPNPPSLVVGRGVSRAAVDNKNRRITEWGATQSKGT